MRIPAALILLSSVLLSMQQAHADPVTYNFTDVTVPGGSNVQANGINNKGQITGVYDANGASHGFIDKNGQVTTFDVPGATSTTIAGINDLGQIAGSYAPSGSNYNPHSNAFLDDNGTITSINIPGSSYVQVGGINNAGQIVGWAQNFNGTSEATFLYTNGIVTTIQVPGSIVTYASGINNAGQIVGNFVDAANSAHGFLYASGVFTTLDAPASVGTLIRPTGINDNGVIVGTAELISSQSPTLNLQNIFVDNGGVFTVVKSAYLPISHGIPFVMGGVNNAGQFVGSYDNPINSGPGFLATPTTIPEPASLPMLAAGLAALGIAIARRKRPI